jgi:hypothetical protein
VLAEGAADEGAAEPDVAAGLLLLLLLPPQPVRARPAARMPKNARFLSKLMENNLPLLFILLVAGLPDPACCAACITPFGN